MSLAGLAPGSVQQTPGSAAAAAAATFVGISSRLYFICCRRGLFLSSADGRWRPWSLRVCLARGRAVAGEYERSLGRGGQRGGHSCPGLNVPNMD